MNELTIELELEIAGDVVKVSADLLNPDENLDYQLQALYTINGEDEEVDLYVLTHIESVNESIDYLIREQLKAMKGDNNEN